MATVLDNITHASVMALLGTEVGKVHRLLQDMVEHFRGAALQVRFVLPQVALDALPRLGSSDTLNRKFLALEENPEATAFELDDTIAAASFAQRMPKSNAQAAVVGSTRSVCVCV